MVHFVWCSDAVYTLRHYFAPLLQLHIPIAVYIRIDKQLAVHYIIVLSDREMGIRKGHFLNSLQSYDYIGMVCVTLPLHLQEEQALGFHSATLSQLASTIHQEVCLDSCLVTHTLQVMACTLAECELIAELIQYCEPPHNLMKERDMYCCWYIGLIQKQSTIAVLWI